jgi:hypothetical protein
LNDELPGITKKYGANLPIDILIDNLSLSSVTILPAKQFSTKLSYTLKFQLNPQEAAATLRLKTNAYFNLALDNSEQASFIMKSMSIDSIEVVNSTIGLTNMTAVTAMLPKINGLTLAAFNEKNDKLPLP